MTISVPGYGSFEIKNESAPELVSWLEQNSVKVSQESANPGFDGVQLING